MRKRRNKEELLETFHHLFDIFDAVLDAAEPIPDFFDVPSDMAHLVATRSQMLRHLEERKATASQLVAGLLDALKDVPRGLKDLRKNRPLEAEKFETAYTLLRGVPFAEDLAKARST